MVFDGDCRFCSIWVRRWQATTGAAVDYVPFQDETVPALFPELTGEQFAKAVHLLEPDGSVYYGAEAAFRALAQNPSTRLWIWLYKHIAPFATVSEVAYRFIAEHRSSFSVLTDLFWGREVPPPSYLLARSIFVRGIGLIYLIAFLSLWVQVKGLIGHQGILPAGETMSAVTHQMDSAGLGLDSYRQFPTFCWFSATDHSLNIQCAIGAAVAVCVMAGVAPAPCLFLLWLIYLSLCTISSEFLSFQWDILLLEAGFLAIFFAPLLYLPWRAANSRPPSRIVLWLIRWLLFRLMFESGCVKLLSGDQSWRNFTALTFHYETQPLPTWIGWYAHQLPAWINRTSCFLMFGIELVLPFFVFAPRRLRHWTGFAFIGLQILIFLTGNYCFFNLLTVLLCVSLFDDVALRKFFRLKRRIPADENERQSGAIRRTLPDSGTSRISSVSDSGEAFGVRGIPPPFRTNLFVLASRLVLLLLVLILTLPQLYAMLNGSRSNIAFAKLQEWFAPFRTFNSYGLFAVMTRPRYEIIVQGSNDGQTWLDYEFKYKPGDPRRRPGFVAPHQPRLDWQMWFAALSDYRANPWFVQFCGRLLQNAPDTVALLKTNPFPNKPPKLVRALIYEYHFTNMATRRSTHDWWTRELKGAYLPVISLRQTEGL